MIWDWPEEADGLKQICFFKILRGELYPLFFLYLSGMRTNQSASFALVVVTIQFCF